jgi:hypothetical protein
MLLQAADPCLDFAGADGAERPVAEGRVDVAAQVRLHLRGGRGPVDLGDTPPLGAGAEPLPASAWVPMTGLAGDRGPSLYI